MRKLVYACRADKSADTGDARIFFIGINAGPLGADLHGTEFIYLIHLAILADSVLLKKDRSLGSALNQNGDNQI